MSCTKCIRGTLFFVNALMVLLGVTLIVIPLYLQGSASEELPIAMSDTVIYGIIGLGVVITLLSFIGCLGAKFYSQTFLTAFFVALLVCLALEIAVIVMIYIDDSLIRDNAESQWNDLAAEKQEAYEADNNCSGFDGCYASIEQKIRSNLMIIGGVTIGVFVYQLACALFACCLCCRIMRATEDLEDRVAAETRKDSGYGAADRVAV